MEKKALIMLLAVLSATAALAMAVPATSLVAQDASGISDLASKVVPRTVVMAITAGNVTDGNVTFSVPYTVKVFRSGDVDYATLSTTSKSASGSLNAEEGVGMLSTANILPATSTTDYLNESTIPVAGTNAVIALQDLNMTDATGGEYRFESRTLSVYLPDGTARTFTLNKPITLTSSADQRTMTIEAEPAVVGTIAGTLGSGVTFPPDAKQVRLIDILAAKQP
jgi:hypothetical protein